MSDRSSNILSLYEMTVAAVCDSYKMYEKDCKILPDTVLFDIYIMLYQQARLCILAVEFSDLDVFSRILKVTNNRIQLIKCFQAVMRHENSLTKTLAYAYTKRCDATDMTPDAKEYVIDLGIRLGGFLCDAGWFSESSKVLTCCKNICLSLPDVVNSWWKILDCCHKLLHAEVVFSQFDSATETKYLAEFIIDKFKRANEPVCLAGLYTQFSLYYFNMSNYSKAYKYSVKAIKELKNGRVSPRITIEALSQASKSCVVKRDFNKASPLVRTAVYLARDTFGSKHPKYADTLLDYGFYLLNSDSMKDSVVVYEKALKLRESIFGSLNLHVAVSHEELAYALYVHEYSTGRFFPARKHAEEAIVTMTKLLPREHLLLASAQRVKALILEEIALDHMSPSQDQSKLLCEAEKLHIDALRLARLSFGEDNVQTAKHYGNLGRLYQSMKRYEEAEVMHLKAIAIKEKLLGREDYEVGLSVGHLASLYNYHMKKYKEAETLYFRSIGISLKLFSETYSGLEYDYRGLVHVYEALDDLENVNTFAATIARWKHLREITENTRTRPLALPGPPSSITNLQEIFGDDENSSEDE